ncbi:hypothetical protein [Thermosyntropha sp.]|uniref:hypothetical protein n=1 Tax=Thermosyntropha sp. TaxID=2740820 RepID=UPI0025ED671B|nr:hypothetical protein [Thermosyntropha sp.]MBO8159737.1 hypothetical protein [Thermosyntropha sp.]
MLKLDFAFFSLNEKDKRGIVYQKFFLDRLTPLFFSPRLERLLYLPYIDKKGCTVKLVLGRQNFKILAPIKRHEIIDKAINIISEYELNILAVDRRFKPELLELSDNFPLTFGDNFIKALALKMTEDYLSHKEVNRLIIVGKNNYQAEFIEEFLKYGVPVSLQNTCPEENEVLAYKFFYEKGYTLSSSYINPDNWEKGDLILFFDSVARDFRIKSPGIYALEYGNNTTELVPDIEEELRRNGINTCLSCLAPVFEACLLKLAGILPSNGEENLESGMGKLFVKLKELGERVGLWDIFLDKAI